MIYRIDGEDFRISKKELEELKEQYDTLAFDKGKSKIGWYYLGKAVVIREMLKCFEQEEQG